MAYIKHFGGQDYKVIDGSKSYGPFDKVEAENFLKDLELENEPVSHEDGLEFFKNLRNQIKNLPPREEGFNFKNHFLDSQRLS